MTGAATTPTPAQPMLRRGAVAFTAAQLERTLAERSARIAPRPGQVIPLLDGESTELLLDALAIRRAGGVPLVGDARWSAAFRAALAHTLAAVGDRPDAGWAALTSGSTGAPRVLVRSAASWSDSFGAVTALLGLRPGDAVYVPVPLVASLSLFAAAHAVAGGFALVLPSGSGVRAVDLADVDAMHATPGALAAALDAIEAGAPSRLRRALIGGAALDPALRSRAETAGIAVVAYYGAAELSFLAVDPDGTGLRPFPGVELELRAGALYARTPFRVLGTLAGDPLPQTEDGWDSVLDLAERLPNGRFRLRGRADGAILTAAATVIPEEVEAALRTLPGVREAVVLGEEVHGGELIVAALLDLDDGTDPAALRRAAADILSLSHRPRRWYRLPDIPRTPAGKPARGVLRDALSHGTVDRLD